MVTFNAIQLLQVIYILNFDLYFYGGAFLLSNTKYSLNGNTIKMIAIVAMIIDHIAWAFVNTNTELEMLMHTIGKLTGPIMFYFIAEGYHYTHNIKRYIARLSIFALISHVPYNIFANNGERVTWIPTSVIFTLLCGLLSIIAYKEINNKILKYISIILLCLATAYSDWSIFGVLFILFFGIFRGDFKKQITAYTVLCLIKLIYSSPVVALFGMTYSFYTFLPRFGMLLVIPILCLYNGKKGGNQYTKWLFYIIYPLQFIVIGLFAILLR